MNRLLGAFYKAIVQVGIVILLAPLVVLLFLGINKLVEVMALPTFMFLAILLLTCFNYFFMQGESSHDQ